jgi:hypothetical protein
LKRSVLAALLLAVLLPGCRSAGSKRPSGPVAPPDALADYVGQLRILRYQGDRQKIEVGPQTRLAGQCDVAVEVRSVTFEDGEARFSLETVGLPAVRGHRPRCEKTVTGMRLIVDGLPVSPAKDDVSPRVDAVLQPPEAYLQAMGVAFDREPGKAPADVASREIDATGPERALARSVTAWPQPLLTVEAWYHDSTGRVRQESEVEAEGVVGTDGRLYRWRFKTSLSDVHEKAVSRALSLWRFEPARRGDGVVGARIALHPVLRIY